MAPEVISKQNYRYQSDLFSIGVIIYRLIMGVMPFKNRHDKAELAKEMLDK
jgi:serine/threonine protein kinase